jgi:hypothetical protein
MPKKMSAVEGALTRELSVRVINISGSGCLIETQRKLEVGTLGELRLKLGVEDCSDDIELVRCETVEGARSIYRRYAVSFDDAAAPGIDPVRGLSPRGGARVARAGGPCDVGRRCSFLSRSSSSSSGSSWRRIGCSNRGRKTENRRVVVDERPAPKPQPFPEQAPLRNPRRDRHALVRTPTRRALTHSP